MTIVEAIQIWCVINVAIYVFARHVFNYARKGEVFLKNILETPELVNNDLQVVAALRDMHIPSFKFLFIQEKWVTNYILYSLVASGAALVIFPYFSNLLQLIFGIVLGLVNGNAVVMLWQLFNQRMIVKNICNRYYNVVESCRIDKERNAAAAHAFMQFAQKINELTEKAEKKNAIDDDEQR